MQSFQQQRGAIISDGRMQRECIAALRHKITNSIEQGEVGDAPVGGSTFLTNMKMAFSGLTFIRFLMTYTN